MYLLLYKVGTKQLCGAGQELARPEEDGAQLGGDCAAHMPSLHTLARRRPWSHDDCARAGARPTSDLVVVLLGWCVLGVLYHPSVPGQCTPFSASVLMSVISVWSVLVQSYFSNTLYISLKRL